LTPLRRRTSSTPWASPPRRAPTRSNLLEETLARIRDCYAPTPIVTAILDDLAGAVGADSGLPSKVPLVNVGSAQE